MGEGVALVAGVADHEGAGGVGLERAVVGGEGRDEGEEAPIRGATEGDAADTGGTVKRIGNGERGVGRTVQELAGEGAGFGIGLLDGIGAGAGVGWGRFSFG
jgi:hypothetical protein